MSYFQDKPKRYAVCIDQVENGYTIHIGSGYLGYEGTRNKTFIATAEELPNKVVEVARQNEVEYNEALKEWEDREKSYAEKEKKK